MEKKFLDEIKKDLLKKRQDLVALVSKNNETNEREVGDTIDVASDSAEREIMFELNDYERILLNDIDNALNKIDMNLYGRCESCKADISEPRLKVLPAARLCIKCQEKSEAKK